jgi:hypothetical protein
MEGKLNTSDRVDHKDIDCGVITLDEDKPLTRNEQANLPEESRNKKTLPKKAEIKTSESAKLKKKAKPLRTPQRDEAPKRKKEENVRIVKKSSTQKLSKSLKETDKENQSTIEKENVLKRKTEEPTKRKKPVSVLGPSKRFKI